MNIKIIKEPKDQRIVYVKLGNTQIILNDADLKKLQAAIVSYFSNN